MLRGNDRLGSGRQAVGLAKAHRSLERYPGQIDRDRAFPTAQTDAADATVDNHPGAAADVNLFARLNQVNHPCLTDLAAAHIQHRVPADNLNLLAFGRFTPAAIDLDHPILGNLQV